MPTIAYKYGKPTDFSTTEKATICEMLIKQGKVHQPTIEKINTFKQICVCKEVDKIVSVGAIKPKTEEDFEATQANLMALSPDFTWELGSCYTDPQHTGKGYSSSIVKTLIAQCKQDNLTAVTDIREDNPMAHILQKAGFKRFGNAWVNPMDEGVVGLFLRFGDR